MRTAPDQGPLFAWVPHPCEQLNTPSMHRRDDHDTSISASERVAAHKSALQGEILAAFVQLGPMTDGELERLPRFSHLGRTTARKRRGELVELGKIAATGARRDGMKEWRAIV